MDHRQILHYRILEELGRGGMGVVYRAEDTRLGRMVAMKFMADQLAADDLSQDRFLQEARAAAALSHPNIATLYGIEDDDGRRFITMEYVDGRTLSDIIARGALPIDRALDLAIQIARGLERAHETGIIHRDIKPANLRITSRGELKILDFGLAKLQGMADISQAGTTVGTAAYMSPEQVLGEEVDLTSDLWSLGVVLYEMLSGRSPFSHQYVQALYYEILNGTAPSVSTLRPEVDPAVDGVLERLMAKEAAHRYPSASELIDDLVRIRSGVVQPEMAARSNVKQPAAIPEPSPSGIRRTAERERRQITTLYFEMARHGELSLEMDPEDMEDLSDWFFDLCNKRIPQFGGHASRATGGGMHGHFGFPVAHERDAEYAVQCGLAVLSEAAKGPREGIQVRAGIHTGLGIVQEMDGRIDFSGGGADVAVRLAETADPGQLVVGNVTYRLVRGKYDVASQGLRDIRGFTEMQPVFAVAGEREVGATDTVESTVPAAPIVGREIELDLLQRQWRSARIGQGRAVLVTGEAGIGKSRLTDAFLEDVRADPESWTVRLICTPLDQNTALHPLVEYLGSVIRSNGDPVTPANVESYLQQSGIAQREDAALVVEMLGMQVPGDWPRSSASPAARRHRLLQVLVQSIAMRAPDVPGVIVLEDQHWADPSTGEWLDLLVEELPALRVLLLVLTRPPSLPAWLSRTHATEIALGKLSAEDLASISRQRAGSKPLPREIVRHIAARTDGVPLFAEELTSMILESGLLRDAGDRYELTGPIPEHMIPTTLHGSLMARLDQQASARQVAQIGSVIGRQFQYRLLKEVDEQADDPTLTSALTRLAEAELVTRRGFVPDASFEFRHGLIRDAAYESLLRNRRRELHLRVAESLAEGPFEASPAVIARHFAEAGLPARAIPFRIEAGRNAMQGNANREAVEQLRAGMALIEGLDEGPERDSLELELLSLLGPAVMMTKGYADPEGEEIFLRVQEICRRVNAMQPLFFSLYGLVSVYLIRGEYERSFDILERSLKTAEELGDERYLLMSHNATGVARMFAGQPGDAIAHLDRVLDLYDAERDIDLGLLGWGDLNVSASTSRQLALQLLGHSDQALAQCRESMAMADGSANHMTIYHAHLYAGLLFLMRREWEACREVMQAYLPMAVEYGDPFYIAIATVVSSLAHRESGQEETFRMAGEVLGQMRAAGFALGVGFMLYHVADGLLAHGDAAAAEAAIDDAIRHLEPRNGEFWEAEVYRLKGEIEARKGSDPEPWLVGALEISRRQGARWLELRAAKSLAPTLDSNRVEEARSLLVEALKGLEGDVLPDVVEANTLLRSLAGG